jgi:hypothetical protein
MPEAHSKFSASAAARWMACPGSMMLSKGKADSSSVYADEGTAAHTLAQWCLTAGNDAVAYLGRLIEVGERTFTVDDDMARHVQVYVDLVREYKGDDGELMVERQVNYSAAIGVDTDDGWGTSDAIIAKGDLLIVLDLKYGQGDEVEAEDNPQAQLYALGALAEFDGIAEFDRVLMVISQPRVSVKPKEWEVSVRELLTFAEGARNAAAQVLEADAEYPSADWHDKYTVATEKGCRWCKAKATCPTLRNEVANTVSGQAPATPEEFADLSAPAPHDRAEKVGANAAAWLSVCLSKVDLIEDWCKAVRAEAETRLLAGDTVPGFKLVQGKRGARAWADAEAAEQMLKTFRLKTEQLYDLKLISPTTAEKLAKAEVIGPRQWAKVQELIAQPEGKLHVAPQSDKREAVSITPVADDFADVSTASAVDDLV